MIYWIYFCIIQDFMPNESHHGLMAAAGYLHSLSQAAWPFSAVSCLYVIMSQVFPVTELIVVGSLGSTSLLQGMALKVTVSGHKQHPVTYTNSCQLQKISHFLEFLRKNLDWLLFRSVPNGKKKIRKQFWKPWSNYKFTFMQV